MRSLFRIVAPVIAALAIALGGASSALASSKAPVTWSPPAASAPSKAPVVWAPPPVSARVKAPVVWAPPPVSSPLSRDMSPGWLIDEAWCTGNEAAMTCFEAKGRVQLQETDMARAIVVNMRQYAAHYEQGVLVAEDTVFTHERFAMSGNETYTTHSVTHLRVNDGDVTCSFQEVFRIVDSEVVSFHEGGTCG